MPVNVKITGDGSHLSKTLTGLQGQVESWGKQIKSKIAAAFGAAVVAKFANNISDTITRIKDMSDQLSVSYERFQQIDFAFKQSGGSGEKFRQIQDRIVQAMEETEAGGEKFIETFRAIGAAPSEMGDVNTVVDKLADNIDKLTAKQLKALGISQRYVQAFRDFAAINRGQAAGPSIFSDENIERIDNTTKALERLGTAAKVFSVERFFGPLIDLFDNWEGFAIDPTGTTGGTIQQRIAASQPATQEEEDRARAARDARLKPKTETKEDMHDVTRRKLAEIRDAQAKHDEAVLELQFDIASAEQKRVILNEKIAKHIEKAANLRRRGLEAEALGEETKAVGLKQQLSGLKEPDTNQAATTGKGSLNQFQQIGGYAGPNPLVDIGRRQLTAMERMQKDIAEMKRDMGWKEDWH